MLVLEEKAADADKDKAIEEIMTAMGDGIERIYAVKHEIDRNSPEARCILEWWTTWMTYLIEKE